MTTLATDLLGYVTEEGHTLTEHDATEIACMAIDAAGLNIPNLDAMDAEDLKSFEIVARQLVAYCTQRQYAMLTRRVGDIQAALAHERVCEEMYAALPDEAKW